MALSSSALHTVTVPTFLSGLHTLTHLLQQAESHLQANNLPPETFLTARLYDDMKPFIFQIQSANNTARKAVAYATSSTPDVQSFDETTCTFADLYAYIDATVAALTAVDPTAFDGKEETTFKTQLGPVELEFTPRTYAMGFALPNFLFHVSTAYGILRSRGVELGKKDYILAFLKGQGSI